MTPNDVRTAILLLLETCNQEDTPGPVLDALLECHDTLKELADDEKGAP